MLHLDVSPHNEIERNSHPRSALLCAWPLPNVRFRYCSTLVPFSRKVEKKPNSVHFSSRHSQTALPFWVQKFSTCKHHEITETNPYHAPCIIVRYQPVPHNKPEISQFLSTPACCDPKDSAQLSSEFRGNHAPTSVIQEIQLESHFFLCLQQLKYHILTNCFYVPECRNNRKYSHKCSFLYLC